MDIFTTLGMIDESLLIKKEIVIDNDNEYTVVEEYFLVADPDGPHVKRNVHVTLKKPAVFAEGVAANIG